MANLNEHRSEPTGNTGPSPGLWADCPVMAMLEKPGIGYYYFNDFVAGVDVTSADEFTITQVASGAISPVDMAGGGLLVSSDGNASADDGINAQLLPESWLPAVGKDLWFEIRAKFSNVESGTTDQFFAGLSDTNTTIIGSGALDESASLIGYYMDVNSTAGSMELATIKSGSADIDTAIASVEDDTFFKLGFKLETTELGVLQLVPYVDGVKQTADIVTDTDDIPVEALALSFVAQVEQTSADATITADWVRIAQER